MHRGPQSGPANSNDHQRTSRPRLGRCSAPIRFTPRDLSSTDQDSRYGIEIAIEPLEMITDFGDEPTQEIAVRLREWAGLLNQAATSME
jgi:hypothetical protein